MHFNHKSEAYFTYAKLVLYRIIPSYRLLRGVRWFETDVSGLSVPFQAVQAEVLYIRQAYTVQDLTMIRNVVRLSSPADTGPSPLQPCF